MPIILVVDDSETDRKLMEGLLGADVDWLVAHAKNGVDALEMIEIATPNAVVTDLMMPEMDGMELVAQINETFPNLPVVLVTGQDDASIALKALRQGAASYVPKSQLSEKLLETVEQVLSICKTDHYDERLIQCTTNTRYRFNLDNDPMLIAPLVDRIQHGMMEMNLCSPSKRMHVAMALEEALLNAMYHGNLELPSEQLAGVRKLLHEEKPSPLVEERRQESPYKDRRIQVAADLTRSRAQFVIADQGAGFDRTGLLTGAAGENMDEEAGRGLVLIQTFMDEVEFNETGNEMRITLKDLRPVT